MEKREYLIILYEIYGCLLSDNERKYFEYYYYDDLSLSEIADNVDASKSYVGKVINTINNKLCKYEELLNINSKNEKIKEILKEENVSIKNKIEQIIEN